MMKNPFTRNETDPIDENTWKIRVAQRRYMRQKAVQVAKITLMTAGAVAIYRHVTTSDNQIEEEN